MTPFGRWCSIGALTLAVVTGATWNSGGSRRADAADPTGAQLFVAKGCASCHVGPDSAPLIGDVFPSLADPAAWADDRRDGLDAADYLAESIVAPDAFFSPDFRPGRAGPTMAMPVIRITAEEVDAIVAYLLDV